jgi:peptidoglycan hydrolase-like protein with peptidoglycan-binding domain
VALNDTGFTLGVGSIGPLVTDLHQRLAVLDYLAFEAPAEATYGETTRQAVVAFQAGQGLPTGGHQRYTFCPPFPLARCVNIRHTGNTESDTY